ncbi:hypothetical protein [Caudoviricetes sp.]|nr:hypothetical protein [Caudoviricetes sp.]
MVALRKLLEARDCAVRAALSGTLCKYCNTVTGASDVCHNCSEDLTDCNTIGDC